MQVTENLAFVITPEWIEELSLNQLAHEVKCHPSVIGKRFERGEVPGAYRTDGGQWRIPRGMWAAYVVARALRGDK